MPPEFHFPDTEMYTSTEAVWLPFQPTKEMMTERGYNFLSLVGRLKRGVTLDQARADLDTVAKSIAERRSQRSQRPASHCGPISERRHSRGAASLSRIARRARARAAYCLRQRRQPTTRSLPRAPAGVRRAHRARRRSLALDSPVARRGRLAQRAGLGSGTRPLHRHLVVSPQAPRRHDAARFRNSTALLRTGHAGGGRDRSHTSVLAASGAAGVENPAGNRAARAVPRFNSRCHALAHGRMAGFGRGRRRRDPARRHRAALSYSLQSRTSTARLRNPACDHLHRDAAGLGGLSRLPKLEWECLRRGAPAASIANTIYQPLLDRLRHLPGVRVAALASSTPLDGVDLHTSFDLVGQPKSESGKDSRNAKIRVMSGDYSQAIGTAIIQRPSHLR